VESRDASAHPPEDTRRADAAFGASLGAACAPWRAGGPRRLALLLACLLASVIALLTSRASWFALGGAQATGGLLAAGCPGAEAAEVERVPARALTALHEQLSAIVPSPLGRVYMAGVIPTSVMWTDDDPQTPPSSSTAPAGYEIRWWTLDRDGSEDDVTADVHAFATPTQARETLALAASTRCRRDASVHPLRFPAGASELHWVNPDNAQQWDVLFARGRRLYRVGDVPPEYLLTTTPPRKAALERARDETTPQALACAVPAAGCPATAPTIRDSSLAILAAGTTGRAASAKPPTVQQATAFARAVNLRGYFVPGSMSPVAGEGPVDDRSYWDAFARCAGARVGARSVLVRHSTVFIYASAYRYEVVYSIVAVEPTGAQASRYIATVSSQRGHACIARANERLLPGSFGGSDSAHATQVAFTSTPSATVPSAGRATLTPLPTPTPTSYRGTGPYRATALRVQLPIREVTRRGRLARAQLYTQSFVFAAGPALVGLTAFTFEDPYPQEDQRFLERLLVGRAEANEGLL